VTNQPILTITLNPALDVTTSIDRLRPRQKLRCSVPRYDAGGGGANVSRAIRRLGGSSTAFVAIAGATGRQHRDLLAADRIDTEIWETDGETRMSLTVMEEVSGEHFRFVLPGPEFPTGEIESLLARLAATIADGYRFVVASGSLPPGLPVDCYARLARLTRDAGAAFIVDTAGPALTATFAEHPYLIRLNHHEAQELTGGGNPEATAHKLTEELVQRHAADVVIVSIAEGGAVVATGETRLHIRPPRVKVQSTVGAGDSFVGALTLGLARGWPLEDACRYGVAAAASAVTTPATELCEAESTERYFREISGPAADMHLPLLA
jgi:6-phosphofructokinase 2